MFQTDKEDWDAVKSSFLHSFDCKHSAKTACANLQEITQKSGDSMFTYFSKNIVTFKLFMFAKCNYPIRISQPTTIWRLTGSRRMDAIFPDAVVHCWPSGWQQKEITKMAHGTFLATYKAAPDLKVIQTESKAAKQITVTAFTALRAKEQEEVNAVCAQRNTPSFTPNRHAATQCRYWNCYWHLLCDCLKCEAARTPMINTLSQNYTWARVSTAEKPVDKIFTV
jgi:hypothetical protein